MRLTPGTLLGPYEVLSTLGTGGMAEVYRARDTRLGRDIALKVVNEALAGNPELVQRFEQEARLAGSLNHPNLVAVYDFGRHEGTPYFITELLKGESLRVRLSRGRIPLDTALAWGAQIAEGLAAAHGQGIVHRDVKPENVFITSDGHLKLLDFGIAKLVESAPAGPHGLLEETATPTDGHTRTGAILGTPAYMSPEQVRGERVDARTDIFSLGAVLYEMLAGQRPFAGGSLVESGHAILHDEPPPLPDIPPFLAQLIRRCLAKDPEARLQSARDLAFNLELFRRPDSLGVTAAAPAQAVPARVVRWRRWSWPLAGVLVALGVAIGTYLIGRATQLRMPVVEQLTSRLSRISTARFSADGRVIYDAALGELPLEVFERTPGSPDAQSLGLRGAELLAVSGRGELAVLVHRVGTGQWLRGTLALVPGAGGTLKEVAEGIAYADWSPAGELAVVRVIGAKRQLEYPLGTALFETDGAILNPRVSPHGDRVAFFHQAASAPLELMVVERRSGAQPLHIATSGIPGGLAWAPSGKEVWFSSGNAIWSSPFDGHQRLVYQGVSQIELQDISRDGRVLVYAYDWRSEATFRRGGHERLLSWMDVSNVVALSDDGRQLLFEANPNEASFSFSYIRPTDGSPPVRIGPGGALDLSPDERWVLAANDDPKVLSLLPVGPGVSKTVSVAGFNVRQARWLRDGRHIVFAGIRPLEDKHPRLYVVPVEGGLPTAISGAPLGTSHWFGVSRDDRVAAAVSLDGIVTLYPLDGGSPVPLPELGRTTLPVQWTEDGQLWVLRHEPGATSRLLRFDVRTRKALEERSIAPTDLSGFEHLANVCITPDGAAMAFDYVRILGNLYLLDGLGPARR